MNRRDALKYTGTAFGFAVTGGTFAAFLQSCQADPSDPSGWTPSTFTKSQVEMIGAIADTMLPTTDTPGAKDLKVHQFIDYFVSNALGAEDQAQAKEGMALLEEHLGKDYASSSAEDQMAKLTSLNDSAIAATEPDPVLGTYIELKRLIIGGYFTSQEIGMEVLDYSPVPGPYKGCVPVEEVGNGKLSAHSTERI